MLDNMHMRYINANTRDWSRSRSAEGMLLVAAIFCFLSIMGPCLILTGPALLARVVGGCSTVGYHKVSPPPLELSPPWELSLAWRVVPPLLALLDDY